MIGAPAAVRIRWCVWFVLPWLGALGGCGRLSAPPADGVLRIDGRSAAAYEASLRRIKDGMDGKAQDAFAEAALVVLSRSSHQDLLASGGDLDELQRRQRERLHGMSVADVLAAAGRAPAPR